MTIGNCEQNNGWKWIWRADIVKAVEAGDAVDDDETDEAVKWNGKTVREGQKNHAEEDEDTAKEHDDYDYKDK